MVVKLNEEKKKNFAKANKFFQHSDEVENLPEEDRSTMWRPAIVLYSLSAPLVWLSLILFYSTNMQPDILCTLAKLGSNNKTSFNETICILKPTLNDTLYSNDALVKSAGWRWGMYQAGLIIPCIMNVVEMCLNRLLLRFRHAIVVFGWSIVYLIINFLGCLMQGSD